jgi:hypothetical protein
MTRHNDTTGDETGTAALTHDFTLEAQAEFDAICDKVCDRLRVGDLPPDEAFWWTRILFEEAVARLAVLSMSPRRLAYDGNSADHRPAGAQAA